METVAPMQFLWFGIFKQNKPITYHVYVISPCCNRADPPDMGGHDV
jgi:hypothetical protein